MEQPSLRLVYEALSFAARHHRNQVRKDDDKTPYVAHPARVMTIVALEFGVRDPEVLAAAVLHDTIEDTNADCDDIIAHFGHRVAGMVADLTKDKRLPEPEREHTYLERLLAAPLEVKLVKLADVIDNLTDCVLQPPAKRIKPLAKAREIVVKFGSLLPSEWSHAIDRLRRQIEATPL